MPPPFHLLNSVPGQEQPTPQSFTISTPPKTDIFASPTIGYHFSAPIIYTQFPILDFSSVKATISVPFTLESSEAENKTLQFDQGGLVFVLPDLGIEVKDLVGGGRESHPRWIKAGIEAWEGKAWGSIVVRERWSDWSLFKLDSSSFENGCYKVTLEMERMGDALMIYCLNESEGERVLVRKVPWVFLEEEKKCKMVMVGVYGARPDPFEESEGRVLEIGIEGFEARGRGS